MCHVQIHFRLVDWLANLLWIFQCYNNIFGRADCDFFLRHSMSLSFSGFAIWYLFHILTKRRKISRKRSASLMATATATVIFRNHQAKKETHPEFWNGYNTSFAGSSKSGNKTSVAQTLTHTEREKYMAAGVCCWRCDTNRCVYHGLRIVNIDAWMWANMLECVG